MKLIHKIIVAGLGLPFMFGATSCDDLDVVNPNLPTTEEFGKSATDLDEVIIACYNHIRMEGTYARVGYLFDVLGGDELNSYSDNDWWRGHDYLNAPSTNEISGWVLRDYSYAINACNEALDAVEKIGLDPNSDKYKEIKGQALFIRGHCYYELACYYGSCPMITDYATYSDLDKMYVKNSTQDEIFDQVEKDLTYAMQNLPSRDKGGEWAGGRATCGAAAGYLARTLMFRHKYDEALKVLKEIIAGTYGTYRLVDDYGWNCDEAHENNEESLFEIQFLPRESQGNDKEYTPVNNSKSPTQGHALDMVYGNADVSGWNDLAATPWLYQLFKSEKPTKKLPTGVTATIDPRLYWTLATYEPDYDNMEGFENVYYTKPITKTVITGAHKGISVAKNTAGRLGLYSKVLELKCGVNLRLMRYSDVLLRAAECENEVNGPTQQAIDWINQVRTRAGMKDLQLSDFPNADALFEQIANVERPKEFGCEHGRLQDLKRWGFFYDSDRLAQIRKHSWTYWDDESKVGIMPTSEADASDSPLSNWTSGHEYLPMYQVDLNANYNLTGTSANSGTANTPNFKVHPVVKGIGIQ